MKPFYSPSNFSARQKREHAERFLQSYGNDHNVRFVFEGPARTDGKTVWLGDYDPDDETFLMRSLAHGMHEMLHVTDTDMGLFAKPVSIRSQDRLSMYWKTFESTRSA